MSYILEGLKKLEQKRKQQEIAPQSISFYTQEAQDATSSSKRPLWFGIIAAALILNAGIMYFYFQKTPDKKISAVPESKTAAPNNVPPNTHAVTPTSTSNVPLSAVKTKSISDTPASKTGTAPVQPEKIITKEDVKLKQSSVGNAERIERKPAPSARTVRLNELPEEIRKVLPEFKVSAHFYSPDLKARFARINDRILHEGDSLNEGLKLEEINPNGTVFNYQGHRFLVGINQN